MDSIRAFVCFDPIHDEELFDTLLEQSTSQSSGFSIVGRSKPATADALCSDKTRGHICDADQLIVLCGEHSESSPTMHAELRIAQQEDKPYVLLWGRRDIMCTKPSGAKSSEGMYSWTLANLKDQIEFAKRSAKWKTPTDAFRTSTATKRPAQDAKTS